MRSVLVDAKRCSLDKIPDDELWLDVPLTEHHKVFMVKSNMLPKYAQCVALFPIQSLAMLVRICRRIESSAANVTLGLPFESQNYATNRYTARPRAINEIEDDFAYLDLQCETEVGAFKRGQQAKGSRTVNSAGAMTQLQEAWSSVQTLQIEAWLTGTCKIQMTSKVPQVRKSHHTA